MTRPPKRKMAPSQPRIIERGNRVMAVCDYCDWSTASTGPKAAGRVRVAVAHHITRATHLRLAGLPEVVPQPCVECPWRKVAAAGWLGPHSAKQWIRMAHGEGAIACHRTIKKDKSWEGARQCAGAAAFRANVLKSPRDPTVAVGPARDDVFGSNQEFLDHHAPGETWEPIDMYASGEDDAL